MLVRRDARERPAPKSLAGRVPLAHQRHVQPVRGQEAQQQPCRPAKHWRAAYAYRQQEQQRPYLQMIESAELVEPRGKHLHSEILLCFRYVGKPPFARSRIPLDKVEQIVYAIRVR